MRPLARFFLCFASAVWLAASSAAQTVTNQVTIYYNVGYFDLAAANISEVDFTPIPTNGAVNGVLLHQSLPKFTRANTPSLTNGYFYLSNAVKGVVYATTITSRGQPQTYNIFADTNAADGDTIGAWTNVVSPTNRSFAGLFPGYMIKMPGATVGYVATATDNKGNYSWQPSQGGGGGGSATNVFFYPGNYTVWSLLGGSNVVNLIGSLTNFAKLSTNAFDTAGSANAATNGLPNGAFSTTNLFDLAGTGTAKATAATNGYPWGVLYDAAGSATAATNGYPWGAFYDAAGTATAATNGYPWGALYDALNNALNATNGLGLASGLAAFRSTNTFAPTNVATASKAGLVKVDNSTITVQADGTISATTGGGGDFTGPASSVGDNFISFNGTSGKLGKDSGKSAASFDVAGAAIASTNGYPWGSVVASNTQYQIDFQKTDLAGCLSTLRSSSNFVDGIIFAPRFGLTKSINGTTISGLGNYDTDLRGIRLTNGISITLPRQSSNVTVVVTFRAPPANSITLFSLGNSTTKSSIEATYVSGTSKVWENYRGGFYFNRQDSGTNWADPLEIAGWTWVVTSRNTDDYKTFEFVRDVNANWRIYADSVQGQYGLTPPNFIYSAPTNTIDPFDTLWIGTAGVTNTTSQNIGTNGYISSVFVFDTTNASVAVTGYQAAMWLEPGNTMDFWMGDSLLAEDGLKQNVPYFFSLKHPDHTYRNHGYAGSLLGAGGQDVWLTNGGVGALTNLPTDKFKQINFYDGAGIVDELANTTTPSALFTALTNITIPVSKTGARVTWIDVPQLATNSAVYNLSQQTNSFLFNQLVRTNIGIGIAQYIPRWDFCTQDILQTNGLFSTDGLHPMTRTNMAYQHAFADLLDGRPFDITSRTFSAPDGRTKAGLLNNVAPFAGMTATYSTNADGIVSETLVNGNVLTNGSALDATTLTGTIATARLGIVNPASGHTNVVLQKSDGTFSTNDLTNFALAGSGGSGTVTSVGLSAPAEFTVSGSPVTGSGTLSFVRGADANYLGFGQTNVGFLKVTNTVNIAVEAFVGGLVVTNGFTNSSLTPNSIVQTDGNRRQVTMANGVGALTNDASGNFGFAPLLRTSGLGSVPGPAYFDANTNLMPMLVYTNCGAGTNLSFAFDGFPHRADITNGPDVFLNFSGSNGSWSFKITTNVSVHSTTAFNKFLAGSNGVSTGVYKITNGIFSVSSYGGTNATQLVPAIGEFQ